MLTIARVANLWDAICRDVAKILQHMIGTQLDPFVILTDIMSK
jgi:hypothetical protein